MSRKKGNNPYLSIVTPSRNDDHGGSALRRMQVFLNGLLEQLEKYRIRSELILVDWNPPGDKPLLKDAVEWPERLKYCTVRAIVVPPSIHQRYPYSEKAPFHFAAANNSGIRRARGEYILPAGMDLLYPDELMAFIAARNLKKDERYRVDRFDVDRNVVLLETLEEQLEYSRDNIILVKNRPVPDSRRFRLGRERLPNLHTSACGDFQLMSNDNWHLVRGFREEEIIHGHCDALLSYASYAAGVKEIVLDSPVRLYHIDHDDKFTDVIRKTKLPFEKWIILPFLPKWVRNKILILYSRLLAVFGYKPKSYVYDGVFTLDFAEYRRIARDVVEGRIPYTYNDENWGLGEESLEEYIICRADWDKVVKVESGNRIN